MASRSPCMFLALVVFAAAAAVATATSSTTTYPPDTVFATTTLAAPSNVVSTSGKGKATVFVQNNGTAIVTVNLTGSLSEITMAHIHIVNASAATNPVFVGLLPIGGPPKLNPPVSYKGSFSFVSIVNAGDPSVFSTLLFQKLLYVNIHTVKYPGGELQGYLVCKSGCKLPAK